jgi:hypothetical protein
MPRTGSSALDALRQDRWLYQKTRPHPPAPITVAPLNGRNGASSPIRRVASHRLQSAENGHLGNGAPLASPRPLAAAVARLLLSRLPRSSLPH